MATPDALQLTDDCEQAPRLVLRERRGRLVERKQPNACAERPHDLDELALSGAEIAGAHPGRKARSRSPNSVEQGERAPQKVALIQEHAHGPAKIADEEIFRHREVRG